MGDFMTNTEKAMFVVKELKKAYPTPRCTLNFSNPLELLIAIRLSAQCTDERVNKVTPALFSNYRTLEDFASAKPKDIEKYIYSCGFYKTKSENIVNMCKDIINGFGGRIPDNMEGLLSLPGIGRKTANLFLGEVYGKPALVVDTHFTKVTKRIGFHDTKDPFKIEMIMLNYIPPEESLNFCHRVVEHGRKICTAHSPDCNLCCIKKVCNYFKNMPKSS